MHSRFIYKSYKQYKRSDRGLFTVGEKAVDKCKYRFHNKYDWKEIEKIYIELRKSWKFKGAKWSHRKIIVLKEKNGQDRDFAPAEGLISSSQFH